MINWRTSTFSGGNGCVEVGWTRSSYCQGGSCVEVGWTTSSFCSDGSCVEVSLQCSNGACVEVSHSDGMIYVRDSKDHDVPHLMWSPQMWESSVWQPIVEGCLPSGATEDGLPTPGPAQSPLWAGGAVTWLGLRFDAEEWKAFVDGVKAGEFAVEVLTR